MILSKFLWINRDNPKECSLSYGRQRYIFHIPIISLETHTFPQNNPQKFNGIFILFQQDNHDYPQIFQETISKMISCV